MRVAIIMAVVVGVFGASAADAQNVSSSCNLPQAPGVLQQQLVSGKLQRTYRLFVPPGYDGRTPIPLVLDMHGSGGTSAGQARNSGFEAVAEREGFAVASLQADGGRWNVPVDENRASDVTYVGDVIDHAASQLCVDLTRVYATGFSGGGRMSSLLGCRLNSRIAAIAPVSGLRWPGPCAGRPIPVLTFHGLADAQNPYDGKAANRGAEWLESVPDALSGWSRYNDCNPDVILEDPAGPLSTMRYAGCREGAEVRMIRIDGLGHTWTKTEVDTTGVMWQFFRNHRLSR
jgi:polyhydroxybutyrate depolymerase